MPMGRGPMGGPPPIGGRGPMGGPPPRRGHRPPPPPPPRGMYRSGCGCLGCCMPILSVAAVIGAVIIGLLA